MNDDFDNEKTDREMSERFVGWRSRPTHTPTPWDLGGHHERGHEIVAPEQLGVRGYVYVGACSEPADARRIVACVNALRDVSTAALEELVKEERELELALTLSTMMKSEPSSDRSRG